MSDGVRGSGERRGHHPGKGVKCEDVTCEGMKCEGVMCRVRVRSAKWVREVKDGWGKAGAGGNLVAHT